MGRVETLQQIKQAESRVAAMKAAAEAEKEKVLKEARRAEMELHESLRKEGEEKYSRVIAEAKQSIDKERETILEGGRQEASAVKSKGKENFERAVGWLVEKLKGAVNA